MRCEELKNFLHPYLDGEFDDSEASLLEEHLASCDGCRQQVEHEAGFKNAVKSQLTPVPAPEGLRERVLCALDEADETGQGPTALSVWRRAIPYSAGVAAAAALVIFIFTAARPSKADPAIVEDAIRYHEKNLPVEVRGSAATVKAFFAGRIPVPVKPPHLEQQHARLRGARFTHLQGRDAAQIIYQVGGSSMTVYVFDASNLPMAGRTHWRIHNREVYVDGARGYNVVLYRDHGVGYAFTSDLDEQKMLSLVSASLGAR